MELIQPKELKLGDEIRIISTARAVDKSFVEFAQNYIEQRGFTVSLGENLFKVQNQFAGSDKERLFDLNEAIRDPKVRAIFCARGGYGTARILEGIDLDSLRKDPKWICGYSDITALLNHIFSMLGIIGAHSTMPVNFEQNSQDSLDTLFEILQGKLPTYSFNGTSDQIPGQSTGNLIGGNLSVLYSILGTKSLPDPKGKILFMEDLDEYLYHIDRMILNLKRSGFLSGLEGIILGGLTEMNDNSIPFGKDAQTIILEHCSELGIPVATNFPSGHFDRNLAWIHGKKIRLTAQSDQPNIIEYLD